MTAAALRLKWQSPQLQMNGRPGQKQFGIDIHGPDELGRPTGVQCKLTHSALTLDLIKEELEKAKDFGTTLTTIYMATTLAEDSHLQREVRILSMARALQSLPAVGVLFWGDIVDGLALNPQVFRNFYPNIDLVNPLQKVSRERLRWCVDLGYFGPYIWHSIELVLGEFGWMAQEDPDQLLSLLELVEAQVLRVYPEPQAAMLQEAVVETRNALFPPSSEERDFALIERAAKRVAQRMRQWSTLLSIEEGRALALGMRLGAVSNSVDAVEAEKFESLVSDVLDVLGREHQSRLQADIDRIRAGYNIHHANSLFNLALRELLRQAAA